MHERVKRNGGGQFAAGYAPHFHKNGAGASSGPRPPTGYAYRARPYARQEAVCRTKKGRQPAPLLVHLYIRPADHMFG